MFFRMVYDDKLAQAAYLIGCQRTGDAIVIDPERDVDRYEKLAAANGLRIVAVTETHIHADFLSGVRELAEKGVKVYLSDEGDTDWKYLWLDKKAGGGKYSCQLLKNGDTFAVGRIEFKALHTPGHTPEHICFAITDRGGGADKPLGVVTGDFVFVGDLGRPDLLETAAGLAGQADRSAHRLFQSVRGFLQWPDYQQVWPGHGAGSACGKAVGAVPQSTVGYEKMFNPSVVAARSEGEFVKHILDGQPEPPLYFARMKRDNRAGPKVLGGVPQPRRLSPGETRALNGGSSAIVDTRTWDAFRTGHIPGALYLPLSNSFSTDAGSMIDERENICLVVESAKLDDAVRGLIRVGLDNIAGWADPSDLASRSDLVPTKEVTAEDALAMVERGAVHPLDARRAAEFSEGHIPGATNITHTRLRARLSDLPKDKPILVNCHSGGRSARACSLLQRNGYDVANLAGGFVAWEQASVPAAR